MAKSGISGTVILNCTCVQTFQDKTYGSGRRIHNLKKTGDKANCTGCGATHDTGRVALAEKKKADKADEKTKEAAPEKKIVSKDKKNKK